MSWYVLHVAPRTEKKVAVVCGKHSIAHYLPLREEMKVYQRRKVVVWKPLFSGYLFADLASETRVHVLRTNHILQIICPSDESQLIHELKQVRLALAVNPRLMSEPSLCRGQRVLIKGGVFAGIEGVVADSRNEMTVRLNVEMVGQSVGVDVDRDFIEALGK